MAATEKENKTNAENEAAAAPDAAVSSELRLAVWSVISFDKCEASGLTYQEAERVLGELEAQKISGLCIVPDEVAARMPVRKP